MKYILNIFKRWIKKFSAKNVTYSLEIIKEYFAPAKKCIIRTDTYAKSLEHFNNLFKEAIKEYPDLSPEKIIIVHYAGEVYRYMYGIEFYVDKEPSKRYRRIEKSEMENCTYQCF